MTPEEAFFSLYEGLPRQGPGSENSTHEALRRFGKLPRPLRVIDLGCGSGASTLLLARELKIPGYCNRSTSALSGGVGGERRARRPENLSFKLAR